MLFEGAQGTLLDLDHGTYPFVTSSSPIAAGAAVSFGIGPNRIDEVLGVAKAYVTRVGEGPFPSEIDGPDHERVQALGHEFGTVTGRERRCGWLDLVALRFAVRVNGITSLALTKLDVLSEFAELPVCVRYRLPDDSETEDFPAHQSDFHHCRPVFEVLPGWGRARSTTSCPRRRARTSRSSSEALGVPVTLVGTGAAREHVLALADRVSSVGVRDEELGELAAPAVGVEAAEEDVVVLALEGVPIGAEVARQCRPRPQRSPSTAHGPYVRGPRARLVAVVEPVGDDRIAAVAPSLASSSHGW